MNFSVFIKIKKFVYSFARTILYIFDDKKLTNLYFNKIYVFKNISIFANYLLRLNFKIEVKEISFSRRFLLQK